MRRQASYPSPHYRDPKDTRFLASVRQADGARPEAVNLLGVPFDGAVLGRKGAAGGPSAIRQSLSLFSNYNPELGVDTLGAKVFDLGDIVVADEVGNAHAEVEREVGAQLRGDSLLVVLGGDNSVSLPSVRAMGKKFRKIGLVVVDSHFDLRGEIGGKPTSGSSYGLAIRTVSSLDPRKMAEIGIHGFLNSRSYAQEAKRMGLAVYSAVDVRQKGATATAREAFEIASEGTEAVYFSIDLDAVDLAYVSGVSAPSAGGMSATELFDIAYYLGGREKVKCADIVELAPNLDPSGKSQVTAATALVYLVAGFCSRSIRSSKK